MRRVFLVLAILLIIVILIPIGFSVSASLSQNTANREAAPKTGAFVKGGDVQLFIQESGSSNSPAVVLNHGTGAWGETWRPTMEFCKKSFRMLAIDQPPFGYSDRPQKGRHRYSNGAQGIRIARSLKNMGIHQAILVGHSFGARAMVAAALNNPKAVKHLILVDAALGITERDREGGETPESGEASDGGLLSLILKHRGLRNTLVNMTLGNPLLTRTLVESFVFRKDRVSDEIVDIYKKPMNVAGSTKAVGLWLRDFLNGDDKALAESLKEIGELGIPTTLIWGREDSITPLWQTDVLQKKIPQAKIHIIDNVGHIPQIEDPETFNQLLLETLCSIEGKNCA